MHDLALDQFFDAILAKRKRISSDHSNFPNPARPESLLLLGCGGGGSSEMLWSCCVF